MCFFYAVIKTEFPIKQKSADFISEISARPMSLLCCYTFDLFFSEKFSSENFKESKETKSS